MKPLALLALLLLPSCGTPIHLGYTAPQKGITAGYSSKHGITLHLTK
jgi:hypothetical protein